MKKLTILLSCLLALTLASCTGQSTAGTENTDAVTAAENTAETEAKTEASTEPYTVTEGEDGVDFTIDFPAGKDITVLQLTDTQMQNYYGARNQTRKTQTRNAFFTGMSKKHEDRVWRYMDEAVERTCPDIIVLTGDNIYGELDDDGRMWLELIEKMDSYKIPWLTVFGNHDNESAKGVMWQIEQLQKSEYCLFSQGNVTGNSNYSVLITRGGKAEYLFYMIDTNGCKTKPSNPGEGMMPDNIDIDKIQQSAGVFEDQLEWIRDVRKAVSARHGDIPSLMFLHIPPAHSNTAVQTLYGSEYNTEYFVPTLEGDLGISREAHGGFSSGQFWSLAKKVGCKGMFVGHQHKIATSVVYDGIRITYGLKTGTYDYHAEDMLGSTKITLPVAGGDFTVTYIHSELEY